MHGFALEHGSYLASQFGVAAIQAAGTADEVLHLVTMSPKGISEYIEREILPRHRGREKQVCEEINDAAQCMRVINARIPAESLHMSSPSLTLVLAILRCKVYALVEIIVAVRGDIKDKEKSTVLQALKAKGVGPSSSSPDSRTRAEDALVWLFDDDSQPR
jgi:hypothetical protein